MCGDFFVLFFFSSFFLHGLNSKQGSELRRTKSFGRKLFLEGFVQRGASARPFHSVLWVGRPCDMAINFGCCDIADGILFTDYVCRVIQG